jgi:hypothetical protein
VQIVRNIRWGGRLCGNVEGKRYKLRRIILVVVVGVVVLAEVVVRTNVIPWE